MDKDTDTLHVVQEFKRDGWTFDDDEPVLVGDHAIVICHDRTASNMLIFEKANMAEPVSTLCFDARIPAGGRGAWVRTHFR
jgi:carotenoid cleavage dioxygenase-like enzyme